MNDIEIFEIYSGILIELIYDNMTDPNPNQIKKIRSYWDNEEWDSIVTKLKTEGSASRSWWCDGVDALIASGDFSPEI